jgi:hypothetical protein
MRASSKEKRESMTKEERERRIFDAFIAKSGLSFAAESVKLHPPNGNPPPPDVSCLIDGQAYFFELAEVVDSQLAEGLGTRGRYQKMFPDPDNATERALELILAKKAEKEYQTDGSPVDLVLYFNKDLPMNMHEIDEPLQDALERGTCGQFSRIWLYDTWTDAIRVVRCECPGRS